MSIVFASILAICLSSAATQSAKVSAELLNMRSPDDYYQRGEPATQQELAPMNKAIFDLSRLSSMKQRRVLLGLLGTHERFHDAHEMPAGAFDVGKLDMIAIAKGVPPGVYEPKDVRMFARSADGRGVRMDAKFKINFNSTGPFPGLPYPTWPATSQVRELVRIGYYDLAPDYWSAVLPSPSVFDLVSAPSPSFFGWWADLKYHSVVSDLEAVNRVVALVARLPLRRQRRLLSSFARLCIGGDVHSVLRGFDAGKLDFFAIAAHRSPELCDPLVISSLHGKASGLGLTVSPTQDPPGHPEDLLLAPFADLALQRRALNLAKEGYYDLGRCTRR